MNRPFDNIIGGNIYSLKHGWGGNRVDIVGCLKATNKQYGDNLSEKDFTNLITFLTKGAQNSIIGYRREPEIITTLCELFPIYMNNVKIITNILKCITVSCYPQHCIISIKSVGYKFTDPQIKQLNVGGYNIFDIVDTMNYPEFLSLFNNSVFLSKILSDLGCDYDTPFGNTKIQEKIITFKTTLTQFNLSIDNEFINTFLSKIGTYFNSSFQVVTYARCILNVHIIAKELGLGILSKENFIFLIEKYPNFYGHNIPMHIPILSGDKKIINENARKLLKFYDNPITRDVVLHLMNPNIFITFVTPETSSYDPAEDIFYILYSMHEKKQDNDRYLFIKHLINNNYLIYDDFLMLLISLGLTEFTKPTQSQTYPPCAQTTELINRDSLLIECIGKNTINLTQHLINNIFTFCNFPTINALSDLKIIPTKELLSLNISKQVVHHIANNSVFADDDIAEFSELVNSYIYEPIGPTIPDTKNMAYEFINIYNSLNTRDKQIYVRMKHGKLADIIRYNVTLTKEYIASILRTNNWNFIVFLLHLSHEYDYIIDFIDEYMIMMIPAYIGRLWFYNNIIIKERQNFYHPNKLFEYHPNVENDVIELLKKPVCFDITEIENDNRQIRENNRINLINSGCCTITRTSAPSAPYAPSASVSYKPITNSSDEEAEDYEEDNLIN